MWKGDIVEAVRRAQAAIEGAQDDAAEFQVAIQGIDQPDEQTQETMMRLYMEVERHLETTEEEGIMVPVTVPSSTVPTDVDEYLDGRPTHEAMEHLERAETAHDDLTEAVAELHALSDPSNQDASLAAIKSAQDDAIASAGALYDALQAASDSFPAASAVQRSIRKAERDQQLQAADNINIRPDREE